MLRVGILGVGGISGAHISGWKTVQDAKIVAMCDIRPEKMEKHQNVNKYTDFKEMIKSEQLDIIDICLPTYLHAEYSIKAMEKGINVLCEKPVSLNESDIEKLFSCAKENNVKFMIAQVLRFWREYEYVKQVFEDKRYGKLLSGNMSRLSSYPKWSWDNWMFDEKRSGLVPFDLHIHDLDFLVYAFGAPKKQTVNRSKLPDQDVLSCVYEFEGFFVNVEAAWFAAPIPFAMKFRFQFEKAVMVFENNTLKVYENNGKVFEPFNESIGENGNIGLPKSSAYAEEIKYFANAVLTDTQPDKVTKESLEIVLKLLKNI